MPQVPIIMPQLGESIAEATIVDIKVKPGDEVADDQEIIDVETNKAVMGVTTPCKGKIDKITVQLKETYPVGAVLGYVEASEADAARFAKQAPSPPQREVAEEIPARADQEVAPAREKKIAAHDGEGARIGGLPVPAITKGAIFMSPRARAHGRVAINNGGLGRDHGHWRGESCHHQGSRKFRAKDREANRAPSFRYSRGRGRRHAAELDAFAFDHRLVGESRSGVARSALA